MNSKSTRIPALVALAALLVLLGWKLVGGSETAPNAKLYQIVMLSNGENYIGRLHAVDSNYPYLTEVFYLRQQPQKLDDKGKPLPPDYTVIKRGLSELHAPEDKFYISRQHLIYWENVGDQSLVARGVRADIAQRAKAAQAQQAK